MLIIKTHGNGSTYKGNVTVTDTEVEKLNVTFDSKFKAFGWAVEQKWTKACIMKYILNTTRDQYFYNYLIKLRGSNKDNNNHTPTVTQTETETETPTPSVAPVSELRKTN